MNVLIIGGTGTISTYVVKKCLKKNMNVFVMNRGSHPELIPNNVHHFICDINHKEDVKQAIQSQTFDCVIDFVAFNETDVKRDIELFKDITKQYIFISSASAYQKPMQDYPITEETPLDNPYWSYSRDKIDSENYLKTVKKPQVTIVRPSHTYHDHKIMAVMTRWSYEYAHMKRLIDGKPIIIPGDGTSVWTITHASDFANSFVDLIGNPKAYGETYHITSDKMYTWEQLARILAKALHVEPNIVHIPSDVIVRYMPEMEGPLYGDKMWSAIFDNSKIKAISSSYTSTIGYEDIVDQAVSYYQTHKGVQRISDEYESLYDQLIKTYLNQKT